MFEKERMYVVSVNKEHQAFNEYLCAIPNDKSLPSYYNVRIMKKTSVAVSDDLQYVVKMELKLRSKLRHIFLSNQIWIFQDYDYLYYISSPLACELIGSEVLPSIFTVPITKFYIAEIFCCLKYLHSKNIHYTFLSPGTIFLSIDGHIKLDFTLCNCVEYSSIKIENNLVYASIQYITEHKFSYLSDFWSLGIIIYRMLFGVEPFLGDNLIERMLNEEVSFDEDIIIDEETKDFIRLLLDKSGFKLKPSCFNLERKIINHAFFKNTDWVAVESGSLKSPISFFDDDFDLKSTETLDLFVSAQDKFQTNSIDGYSKMFKYYNMDYSNKP